MSRMDFQTGNEVWGGWLAGSASQATWRRPGGLPASLLAAGEGRFEQNDDLVDQRTPVGDRRLDQLAMEGGRNPNAQVLEDILLRFPYLHPPRVTDFKDHYKYVMVLRKTEPAVILGVSPTPAARPLSTTGPHQPASPREVDPSCTRNAKCPTP